MLVHAFLSGLGIALSYTLISILIVDSHQVTRLPILYIITAVLLLGKGFFYAHLEHSNQPRRLFSWVLVSLFMWSFFMYFNLRVWDSFLIIALAYCSYYVTYVLSNLEYWGTASLLFDVRQGKRLFGLLSSGESVAKILGYALTPFIITTFDTATVYLVVGVCFAGAYLIFKRMSNAYKPSMAVVHQKHSKKDRRKTGTVLTILSIKQIFSLDKFRKNISIFSLLSTLTLFLLQYAFLLRVEERFIELEDIAVFFGTILTIAKFLNLIIKVFLSSRMSYYLGLKVVLLLLPVLLLITNVVGAVGISTGQFDETFIMWIFTVIIIIDEVFRTSLYTPAYLTLFQPLTKVKRLEGHTLTKGIMEPIGLGLAGVLIYVLKYVDSFHLHTLTPIVLILLCFWIFAGHRVFLAYLDILKDALKSKILNRGTLNLSRNEYNILRHSKLTSRDPLERLYALQMLDNSLDNEEKRETLRSLYAEEDAFIIRNALEFSKNHDISDMSDCIKPLLEHEDSDVRKKAIYEYARINALECVDLFKNVYESRTLEDKSYIIGAAVKFGGLLGAMEFGSELMKFINSENPQYRSQAAKVMAEIGNTEYYHPLVKLLNDDDLMVRKSAIIASGTVRNKKLLSHILENRHNKKLRTEIRKVMGSFGELLVPFAEELLIKSPTQDRIELIRLFDGNHSKGMTEWLIHCLKDRSFDVRKEALNSLYNRSYSINPEHTDLFNKLKNDLVARINGLLKTYPSLDNEQLRELAYNEMYHIQLKSYFHILSFQYSKSTMKDVINNCYSAIRSNRILAVEFLDNSMYSMDKLAAISMIERIYDLEQQRHNYSEIQKDETDNLISQTILDNNEHYSSWMTANFIRLSQERGIEIELDGMDDKFNEIHIIRQEAERLIQKRA